MPGGGSVGNEGGVPGEEVESRRQAPALAPHAQGVEDP